MLPPRPGQARHQAGPHRIADTDHHDRQGGSRHLGRLRRRRSEGRDQVDRAADELAHDGREAVGRALAVAVFIGDVLTFDVAELA
jgi:hypothetical protein